MNDDRLNRNSASEEMPGKVKIESERLGRRPKVQNVIAEIPLTIRLRVVEAIILEAERKIAEDLRLPSLVVVIGE
mgnify:CR=1 FL=1